MSIVVATASGEEDALYEIIDGERKEIPRMGALAATIASFLVTHLNNYGWARQLGFAVAEALFQLVPGRPQRRPDLAFVAYADWQPPEEDPPAWAVVPLLAAEVVGPTNTAEDMEQKLQEYSPPACEWFGWCIPCCAASTPTNP